MTIDRVEKICDSFKSFDGTSIYYEVRGEGEPLVLIYGIACLINHWKYQIDHFAKTNKVIVLDLRGHHLSATPQDLSKLSIDAMADDIKCLLDHLKITKAHFAGHSFGVPVLVKTFEKHPNLFQSMILINGFVENPIKNMFGIPNFDMFFNLIKQQYKTSPQMWNQLWKKAVDNPITALATGLMGGFNLNVINFKDIEIYVRGVANMSLEVFLTLFEDMMAFNGNDILEKINVPTLVVSGEKDFVTPAKYQHTLQEKIKGSEFLLVPYGSHCTQLDFPDYINLKIEKFLKTAH